MQRQTVVIVSLLLLVIAGLAFGVHRALAQAQPDTIVNAYTEASQKRELKFNGMGLIKEVLVKEGEPVKQGQALMRQDDEIELLELERLKAEADSNARVEAAEADLDVKKKTYERKSNAGPQVYNAAEIEEAELDVTFRAKQLEIAKLESSQNKIKSRQQQAKVDRMTLASTIDGVVSKIEIWEGELADPSKTSIVVVKNDPMYVMLKDLNTRQVAQLRVGQELEVRYPEESAWRKAKIVFISPVADAASDRQFVRLELPNPEKRATGLEIQVKVPLSPDGARAGDKHAENR